jgi:hypothetical protein
MASALHGHISATPEFPQRADFYSCQVRTLFRLHVCVCVYLRNTASPFIQFGITEDTCEIDSVYMEEGSKSRKYMR